MQNQDQIISDQTPGMKAFLMAEETAITAIAVYFLYRYNLGISFWLWIPLFLSPDISMLGYLINTRIGAYTYNLFHHRAVGLIVGAIGYWAGIPVVLTIGILLFAHSSFDRMMGYGLKYTDSFKHTHLGHLPEAKKVN